MRSDWSVKNGPPGSLVNEVRAILVHVMGSVDESAG